MRFKKLWKKKQAPSPVTPPVTSASSTGGAKKPKKFWAKNRIFKKNVFSSLDLSPLSSFSRFTQAKAKRLLTFAGKHKVFLFCLFLSLMISDLFLIKTSRFLLPEKVSAPPTRPASSMFFPDKLSLNHYKAIWENNIFHLGPIPDRLKEEPPESFDPVPTSLPFKLRGTIVHADPKKSVATILAGVGKTAQALKQGEDIAENQARIVKIQRGKVIFLNQDNNRLEYILLPKEKNPINIAYQTDKPKSDSSSLVKRFGNSFQVKRSDINDYLEKLPEILRQARVVPHRSSSGEVEGWRFASINKDSIWEKHLGFKKGDIIKQVDGEIVTSPEQALELFERLREDSSGFKILIEQDGKEMEYEYSVRENVPILM